MFLVVGVSMIIDLVAKITMSMRMLCVCGVLVCTNVCVCVCECAFLWYQSCFLRINNIIPIFFAFLYPRNLLPGHVTTPFLASVTQRGGLQHQDDHSNDKFIY